MDDLVSLYHRDGKGVPLPTTAEVRRMALRVVASRRRLHLAALAVPHVAVNVLAILRRVLDGDLTLDRILRLVPSDLVPAHRRAGLSGKTLKAEVRRAALGRLAANLPTAEAVIGRGRMRKAARLLYECGVRTQKLGGLVAEAAALDPSLDLAAYRRRRAVYEGCRAAVAEGNRRLAWRIADRNQGHGQPLADLIGHANVGLMRAVEQFDPGLGFMFSTFAVPIIKNAVRRAVGDESRAVRVPPHTREVAVRVHWARAELVGRTPDREPTYQEIVAHIKAKTGKTLTAGEAERADLAVRPVGTLNADPDGDDTAGQTLAGGDGAADAAVMGRELAAAVGGALAVLPYRQRTLLAMRYGLGDGWRYTLDECGQVFGVTRQAVQQAEGRALAALRQPSLAGLLAGHL